MLLGLVVVIKSKKKGSWMMIGGIVHLWVYIRYLWIYLT